MERPENTLCAFKYAVSLQVDMIETDVRMTKDKQIIICHDDSFERLCPKDARVRDTLYKDLPKFK